uniref:Uncharacterized protein n=1 Tax=Pithovirus LCPAC304 TaxID=2506594 RepID=A0A481Z8Y0_9VIRU|nr:MAG: hypothetical protein LCPAC304_06910 [Pithovirus LCPAC304]
MQGISLDIVAKIFVEIERSDVALNFARTCSMCYYYFKEVDLPRRIKRANEDETYLLERASSCDPLLFLCDLEQKIKMRITPTVEFLIPKTFDVLKILFSVSTLSFMKKFMRYHPITITKLSTKIWLEKHLKQTMEREDDNPEVLDFMLQYIVDRFEPFKDYFPSKVSPLSYTSLADGKVTTLFPEKDLEIVKHHSPVNTLEDYLLKILGSLSADKNQTMYQPAITKCARSCKTLNFFIEALEKSDDPKKELKIQMRNLVSLFMGREIGDEELNECLRRQDFPAEVKELLEL